MRYASHWLHTYWADKLGQQVIGNIWRSSKYPEDAIQAYTRLYAKNSYSTVREELFDYAMKTQHMILMLPESIHFNLLIDILLNFIKMEIIIK